MEQFFIDFAEAISPAVQILLQGVFIALAAQLSAWLAKKYQVEKANLSTEQQYVLRLVVSSAIMAAEQLYTDSQEKRNYAFSIAEKALAQHGLMLDIDLIYSEIEAQVFKSFNNLPLDTE